MNLRYLFAVFFLLAAIPLLLFAADESAAISAGAFIKKHAAKRFRTSKDQVSVKSVGVIDGKQVYEVGAAGNTVTYKFAAGEKITYNTVCWCCYTRIDLTCGCIECISVPARAALPTAAGGGKVLGNNGPGRVKNPPTSVGGLPNPTPGKGPQEGNHPGKSNPTASPSATAGPVLLEKSGRPSPNRKATPKKDHH